MALGKMADKSPQIAEEIIKLDILPDIVDSITHQNVRVSLTCRDSSRNAQHLFLSRLLSTARNLLLKSIRQEG